MHWPLWLGDSVGSIANLLKCVVAAMRGSLAGMSTIKIILLFSLSKQSEMATSC
jgi:hypothetical protein